MSLDRITLRELTVILLPVFRDSGSRQPLMTLALGMGHPLIPQIHYEYAADPFILHVIEKLIDFGEIEPGVPALWALLEVVQDRVGQDIQARIIALKPKIVREANATPPPATASKIPIDDLTALIAREAWNVAIDVGERILKSDEWHAEARKLTAQAYYQRGVNRNTYYELYAKIEDYTRAIELDPTIAEYWSSRGATYGESGESNRAIADYTRAIELNPLFSEYWFVRGAYYLAKSEYDLAIADFTWAIELDPTVEKYWFMRGEARNRKGGYDQEAIADYIRADELSPRRKKSNI